MHHFDAEAGASPFRKKMYHVPIERKMPDLPRAVRLVSIHGLVLHLNIFVNRACFAYRNQILKLCLLYYVSQALNAPLLVALLTSHRRDTVSPRLIF
jgi:hypothetical protein